MDSNSYTGFATPSQANSRNNSLSASFGGTSQPRSKRVANKASTSLYGGERELGRDKIPLRGGRTQRSKASLSPFGTEKTFHI